MHVVNHAKGSGREKKYFLMYLSCDEYASLISNRRYEVKIQMSSDHVLKGRRDLRYPILTAVFQELPFWRYNCTCRLNHTSVQGNLKGDIDCTRTAKWKRHRYFGYAHSVGLAPWADLLELVCIVPGSRSDPPVRLCYLSVLFLYIFPDWSYWDTVKAVLQSTTGCFCITGQWFMQHFFFFLEILEEVPESAKPEEGLLEEDWNRESWAGHNHINMASWEMSKWPLA